jgi:DNA-directed RNA polymerase III subunit RPC6
MSSAVSGTQLKEFILQFLEARADTGTTSPAVRQSELLAAVRSYWTRSATQDPARQSVSLPGISEAAHSLDQRVTDALNTLLQTGDIQLVRMQRRRGELLVQLANTQRKRLAGLSNTERAVYEQIRLAGVYGIWVRHIRGRLGLPLSDVNRALKELQRRGLVKQVQNIRNKTRKLYMLAELEPSRDVTGGPFYDDEGTFDHEFIHQLRELIWRRLMQMPWSSASELTDFLNQSNVLRFTLETTDLELVLQTMCWDRMLCRATLASARVQEIRDARHVEKRPKNNAPITADAPNVEAGNETSAVLYYACVRGRAGLASLPDSLIPSERLGLDSALCEIPCAKCPVREKCSQQNPLVNARVCPYMEAWTRSMCT